jgi:ATP-binding cassette subfamily B protein
MNITAIAIIWLGGVESQSGGVLAGDLIAVIQYVMQIMFSLVMMSMVFVMYPRAAASAGRIGEVLDTRPGITDKEQTQAPGQDAERTLRFENVTFAFPDAEKPALENLSFEAKRGQTVAIIGSTGSGKSTILNLAVRFYDVTSGRVLLNGVDVRDYKQADLRSRIGYIPQQNQLFSGTIADNLRYGKRDAGADELLEAAKTAQALDFIEQKEDTFDSHVAQGGGNLSGGQKQRLAIARAIVRKPELYLFDDSFSALDFATDAKLRAALNDQTKDAIVLIVAQRISTIRNADHILVLENGRLAGNGTHRQLMESCGVYREIVSSQFSDGEAAV